MFVCLCKKTKNKNAILHAAWTESAPSGGVKVISLTELATEKYDAKHSQVQVIIKYSHGDCVYIHAVTMLFLFYMITNLTKSSSTNNPNIHNIYLKIQNKNQVVLIKKANLCKIICYTTLTSQQYRLWAFL